MKVATAKQFADTIREVAKQSDTAYIYEAFINDMDEESKLQYDSNIRIENEFTVWYLKKLGFEWPKIGIEYLRRYVEYYRNIGYLGI